ncbi:MAG: putative anti-sigma regulatory factor, serine/threonine protein kinase [Acidimicrobiales bacterium]|nr:putative anti-sigma regulatory factor, serine/threonine protein kinase [Acidimicrobiales bacterium]
MSSEGTPVQLTIPAIPRLLRIARVTAASMAAELPFTLQDIEDLRVAVDEVAAVVIDGCLDTSVLELTMAVDGDRVIIDGLVRGAGDLPVLHPVARDLLDLLADSYAFDDSDGDRTFTLTKRVQGVDA